MVAKIAARTQTPNQLMSFTFRVLPIPPSCGKPQILKPISGLRRLTAAEFRQPT
jgi:hypothetical protein